MPSRILRHNSCAALTASYSDTTASMPAGSIGGPINSSIVFIVFQIKPDTVWFYL